MFFCNVSIAEKYNYLDEKFTVAYKWLAQTDIKNLPEGAAVLDVCCGTGDIALQLACLEEGTELAVLRGLALGNDHAPQRERQKQRHRGGNQQEGYKIQQEHGSARGKGFQQQIPQGEMISSRQTSGLRKRRLFFRLRRLKN